MKRELYLGLDVHKDCIATAALQFDWIVFGFTAHVSGPRCGVRPPRWKVLEVRGSRPDFDQPD